MPAGVVQKQFVKFGSRDLEREKCVIMNHVAEAPGCLGQTVHIDEAHTGFAYKPLRHLVNHAQFLK